MVRLAVYRIFFGSLTWICLVVWVIGAIACPALAQYPEKPITILTGYAVDSVGDQIARGLAEAAKKYLPRPILVVNRPGASGTIAVSEALRSDPDGYTLGLGTIGNLTVQPHRRRLPYAGPDTYVPVAKLVRYSNVLMVRTGGPWKTVEEFLNDAREHPGQLTVGVPGLATIGHLNVEQLNLLARVKLKAVYFDGPKQVAAAVEGQVDAAVAGLGPIIPYVRSGQAVVLGVFDERRLPLLPDTPTFKEKGFDVSLGSAQAIVAARATPQSAVMVLDEAIRKALAEPAFVSLAQRTESIIDYKGPEAFKAELGRAFEMNGELLRQLGIKSE